MQHDERRLLAVLIADIVGYSRLMSTNEADTYARVRTIQRTIFQPAILRYRGSIVKWTGDGFIGTFPNAVDAVRAAAEIQASIEESTDDGEPIQVRIGINVGDVILVPSDIYGDAVNVAARLQALAQPGGIIVSRGVKDFVKTGYGFAFDSAGAQSVKNIAEPIDTFHVGFESSGPWRLSADAAPPHVAKPRSKPPVVAIAAAALALLVLPLIFFLVYPERMPFARTETAKAQQASVAKPAAPKPQAAAQSAQQPQGQVTSGGDDDAAQADNAPLQGQFSTSPEKEVRIGRSWQLDSKTCESRAPPEIVITHAPASGKLETRPVEFALRRGNQACEGHLVKGVDVVYTPSAGFTGTDKVAYRTTIGKRAIDRDISINVK